MVYTKAIRFRVTPQQATEFKRLASKAGLKLSCWLRVTLVQAIAKGKQEHGV